MAAAILTSTPDAWQPLATNLAPVEESVITPRMEEINLNGIDFTVCPQEIVEFIELAQVGWGAALGAGKRIGYWATVALIRDFLTAHTGNGVPTRS